MRLEAVGDLTPHVTSIHSEHPLSLPPFALAESSLIERAALRELAERFLKKKQLTGVAGLVLTEEMRWIIALQACLPVLRLGLDWFDDWHQLLIYPEDFIAEQEYLDEDGVLHHLRRPLAGEAWPQGPVIVSWSQVLRDLGESPYESEISEHDPARPDGATGAEEMAAEWFGEECATEGDWGNVIIHEIAHKLDLRSGDANGCPPLHHDMKVAQWSHTFSNAYEDLLERIEQDRPCVLPEDAADDPGEFFAVSSEAFFIHPQALVADYPELYQQLARFYRQQPLDRSR